MSYQSGNWIGESGFPYLFHLMRRGDPVPPRLGLYIYAKQDEQGVWSPVYMGHGDLSVCCEDPDLLACIDRNGATHIHMRLCPSPEDRAQELADLLTRYKNSFAPVGCNVPAP